MKRIPQTENGYGVRYCTSDMRLYQITQCLEKKKHTLWRLTDEGYVRLISSDSPYDLYEAAENDK